MRIIPNLKKVWIPLLTLFPLILSSCHSSPDKEQLLSTAGFKCVAPKTSDQISHLKSLPQGKMTEVVKNGHSLFFLADGKRNLLFIGNQQEYQSYQQLRLNKRLSRDKDATAALNSDASNEWSNWGGLQTPYWGPVFNRLTNQ